MASLNLGYSSDSDDEPSRNRKDRASGVAEGNGGASKAAAASAAVSEGERASEEDEVEPPGAILSSLSALPQPSANGGASRQRGRPRQLPLLEELEPFDNDDDSDEEDDTRPTKQEQTGQASFDGSSANDDEPAMINYTSGLTSAPKRQRLGVDDDDDDDGYSSSLLAAARKATQRAPEEETVNPASSAVEHPFANTNQWALKQHLQTTAPDELRTALKQEAMFTELSSGDIRAEARRYQNDGTGIVANLFKSKGVSGGRNQITNLARAARKQLEERETS